MRKEPQARQKGSEKLTLWQEATRPSSLRDFGATKKDLRTLRMDIRPRNIPVPAKHLPPTIGTGSYQLSIPA